MFFLLKNEKKIVLGDFLFSSLQSERRRKEMPKSRSRRKDGSRFSGSERYIKKKKKEREKRKDETKFFFPFFFSSSAPLRREGSSPSLPGRCCCC